MNLFPHSEETNTCFAALDQKMQSQRSMIEAWFTSQWQQTHAPITCSTDLRNSGFKISAVDTNFFPAGFNNLTAKHRHHGSDVFKQAILQRLPNCQRILLVAEQHTRNPFYFDNLYALSTIIQTAGFECRLGYLEAEQSHTYTLTQGEQLTIAPIEYVGSGVQINDFKADLILLNNDLSEGYPSKLRDIKTPIRPPLVMGWCHRSKFNYFSHYQKVTAEFAHLLEIDPWLISPIIEMCDQINFMEREGEDCLVAKSERMLYQIQKKYDQYQINERPFVVIKADAGTYGMGVMMTDDPETLRELNRKQRTKMSSSKGRQGITKVIIQEGIPTYETSPNKNAVAEPVLYMIAEQVIGGFYRIHEQKSSFENLNAPGMYFEPLGHKASPTALDTALEFSDQLYTYSVIARLASLAAANEREEALALAKTT